VDTPHNPKDNVAAMVRDIIERIERLDAEKSALQADIKHLAQEGARNTGWPAKSFTDYVKMRTKGVETYRASASYLRKIAEMCGADDPFEPMELPDPPDHGGNAPASPPAEPLGAVAASVVDKAKLN
jgi:uncharacterized protein (UPF0335 family)